MVTLFSEPYVFGLRNQRKHQFYLHLLLICLTAILISGCKNPSQDTITDIDGNVYRTVKIGNQVWMAENLKVTRFRNGDSINHVRDNEQWSNVTAAAYCNYNNDTTYVPAYGRLYNWYAIQDNRNIAPEGWHIPTADEWVTLLTYLEGENAAGGKLKEANDAHWLSPNIGATNETGFSALPGGYRVTPGGTFHTLGSNAYWWSTTLSYQAYMWSPRIYYGFADVNRIEGDKTYGFSVRCVKD